MVFCSDLRRLEAEIESLREGLRWLTERVYALEHPANRTVQRQPVAATAPPLPVVERAPEPSAEPEPGPGWEAMLGGNWLNKVGVLVLVIGLALFLWYSFGRMGPAGRVAVSLCVSAVMLAGGVALEHSEKYRIAALGLIGGGWAALRRGAASRCKRAFSNRAHTR